MNHPAASYRQVAAQSASGVGLVVMLYDGAIAALDRATAALEAGEIERKCAQLNRALAILVQLEGVLDFEQGGDVAQRLKLFYVHARAQILRANIRNSKEVFLTLIRQLQELREAWRKLDHLSSAQLGVPPSAQPSPAPSHMSS